LSHDELTQRVFSALGLPIDLYASDPEVKFAAREETRRALSSLRIFWEYTFYCRAL
jgi:hypothetical protein